MTLSLASTVSVVKHYERHLSAVSMVGGFVFDNWAFGPIDHRITHVVFIAYLLVAGAAIALLHYLESRPEEKRISQRVRNLIALTTQFALGALLSGFCVFYLRSAALTASWPYLLVLVAIFVGNEVFRQYHSRLLLSALLFFFSLLSYAILLVPVLLARLGTTPFLLAGCAAVIVFAVFLILLFGIDGERLRNVRLPIIAGALGILAVINGFYFTGILPPLPLALVDADVFHAAQKTGDVYEVRGEPETWRQWFGLPATVHLAPGEGVYIYTAVFVPVRMSTPIVHHWAWYDPAARRWVGQGDVSYTIRGGREQGYRGYTFKSWPRPGDWRVDVTTGDGRPLGRIRFLVVAAKGPVALETKFLH